MMHRLFGRRNLNFLALVGGRNYAQRDLAEIAASVEDSPRSTIDGVTTASVLAGLDNDFWSYVDRDGSCWLWCGGLRRGYPIYRGRSAARVAYELAYSRQPPDGHHVRRRCAGKTCVRPEHLIADASVYVKRPVKSLTRMQADDIRARRTLGERAAELARVYGVSVQHVNAIIRGAVWGGDPATRRPRPGSVMIERVEIDAGGVAWEVLACGHRIRSTPWPNKWRRCAACAEAPGR